MKNFLLSASALVLVAACGGGSDAGDVSLAAGDPAKAEDALAALFVSAPEESAHLSFGDRKMDGATATYTNLEFAIPDAEEPLKVASLTFQGLDVNDAGQAMFSAVTLDDLSIRVNDGDVPGDFVIDEVTLQNPTPEMAAFVGSILKEGEPADFPALEAVGFDLFRVGSVSFQPGEGVEAAPDLTIAKFEVQGVSNLVAKKVAFEGLKFFVPAELADEDLTINLDEIFIDNVDMSLIKAVADNADDEDAMVAAVMDALYANPLDPGFDNFKLDNFLVEGGGIKFTLPSVDVRNTRLEDGTATKSVMDEFTMTFTADAQGGTFGSQIAPMLGMLGYEEIVVKAAAESTYDPETDVLTMPTYYLNWVDAIRIDMTGSFGGIKAYGEKLTAVDYASMADMVDPTAFEDEFVAALSELIIEDMTIKIDDNGLFDKGLALAATMQGTDPEALRGQIGMFAGMIPLLGGETGVDPALLGQVATAVSGFIQEPGTLTVTLKPDTPITADVFMDPANITVERLGFEMTATN